VTRPTPANPARPPRPSRRARLAVLVSGSGRSLLNLLDHIGAGKVDAEVALVIASRECPGAAHARARGVRVVVEPGEIPADRLGAMLDEARIDYVVLAGYLKYVHIPRAYAGRIVNIHPALLPAFGGKGFHGRHVHEAVLAARCTESGCTVHFIDDQFDHGPIILQKRCPILPGDTPETLAKRVFELECEALPEAIQAVIERRAAGA